MKQEIRDKIKELAEAITDRKRFSCDNGSMGLTRIKSKNPEGGAHVSYDHVYSWILVKGSGGREIDLSEEEELLIKQSCRNRIKMERDIAFENMQF